MITVAAGIIGITVQWVINHQATGEFAQVIRQPDTDDGIGAGGGASGTREEDGVGAVGIILGVIDGIGGGGGPANGPAVLIPLITGGAGGGDREIECGAGDDCLAGRLDGDNDGPWQAKGGRAADNGAADVGDGYTVNPGVDRLEVGNGVAGSVGAGDVHAVFSPLIGGGAGDRDAEGLGGARRNCGTGRVHRDGGRDGAVEQIGRASCRERV